VVDDAVVDPDLPFCDLLEAGEHAERSGLAAARRTDQHEEVTVADLERQALYGLDLVEALRHVGERDAGHPRGSFPAPAPG
jgi:hypothetical protein